MLRIPMQEGSAVRQFWKLPEKSPIPNLDRGEPQAAFSTLTRTTFRDGFDTAEVDALASLKA